MSCILKVDLGNGWVVRADHRPQTTNGRATSQRGTIVFTAQSGSPTRLVELEAADVPALMAMLAAQPPVSQPVATVAPVDTPSQ